MLIVINYVQQCIKNLPLSDLMMMCPCMHDCLVGSFET